MLTGWSDEPPGEGSSVAAKAASASSLGVLGGEWVGERQEVTLESRVSLQERENAVTTMKAHSCMGLQIPCHYSP